MADSISSSTILKGTLSACYPIVIDADNVLKGDCQACKGTNRSAGIWYGIATARRAFCAPDALRPYQTLDLDRGWLVCAHSFPRISSCQLSPMTAPSEDSAGALSFGDRMKWNA